MLVNRPGKKILKLADEDELRRRYLNKEHAIMNREVNTPTMIVIIIVVLAIVGVVIWKYTGGNKMNISAQQQKEMMQHMIPPPNAK
jgi:flagellar basal body-associated protein FliL